MFPRLRASHVTVVALVCAVALAPARGDEPCAKCTKMAQKVYAVADLIVPIDDYVGTALIPPPRCTSGGVEPVAEHLGCDMEFMCQQPADASCCQGGCCRGESCCQAASCCPNGACCPNGTCCPKPEKTATNWTALAAPEWCKSQAAKEQPQDKLVNLIMKTVCPSCWADHGGNCTLDFMPIGKGLVVCAPADVQGQVAGLLESLRHLQDIEVAFEVKIVSTTEDTFHRVDIAGDQPVFFDCQQLHSFLETIESDPKSAVTCAPKMTVFNGQKANIRCTDDQFFVTSMNAVKFQGQVVYVPVNNSFPLGYQMTLCPTVSADNSFVRCAVKAELSNMASAKVPLFPVTTFITPVFEGGAQGQPVPFTQFIQQPNIARHSVENSLMIPDGRTAVLYAGKCTKVDPAAIDPPEAPLFDWIYDLVDLLNPPADPQTVTEHLFVLVTPRVIVQHGEVVEAKPMPMGPALPPISGPGAVVQAGGSPWTFSLPAAVEASKCPNAAGQCSPAIQQCAATAAAPCCQTANSACCARAGQCGSAMRALTAVVPATPDGQPTCGNRHSMTALLPPPMSLPYPAAVPPLVIPAMAQDVSPEPLLAKFMAKYRQACAVGDKAKAEAYADCCLAIDPLCFGK